MAQITVIFSSYEEMKDFANQILKGEMVNYMQQKGVGALQPPAEPEPIPAEAANIPVQQAYSAQIAQNTQLPAQTMTGQPVPATTPPAQQNSAPQQVPTTQRTYTLDELAAAAMTLMDKGMQSQLQELLAGYGVDALPMLPQERYGNFATALRGMGAQI